VRELITGQRRVWLHDKGGYGTRRRRVFRLCRRYSDGGYTAYHKL